MNRRVLAGLLVAAVAVGLAPAAPAQAAAADPALVLAPAGGGVLTGDGPLDLDVGITNPGTTALPAGRLTFSMDAGPVASSAALLGGIADPPSILQGQLLTRTTARTPAVQPGASVIVHAKVRAADVEETLSSADGARGLYARLDAGGVRVLAETAVVRMSAGAPRIGLGVVIPLTAPAGTTGLVDAAAQGRLSADGGAWTAALRAAEAMPGATLALDPAVVASIRLAGDDAPRSARDLLAGLRDLPNETVRLPYADGDVALQRAAGLDAPVQPESFAGTSVAATGTATPAPPAPTPGATAGAGQGSGDSDPTAWDWSSTKVVWPVPGTADAGALSSLGAGGTVLLGSGDLADGAARAATGPLASVGSTRVLVADATLSSLLATAASGDGVAARAASASLLGALAADAVGRTTSDELAVVARGTDLSGLAGTLGLLADQAWLRGAPLGRLTDSASPAAARLRAGLGVPSSRAAEARGLVAAEHGIDRLSSAVRDPAALQAPYRLALLGLLSAAWRGADARWSSAMDDAQSVFMAVPQEVSIAELGSRTAIGTDGELRFSVVNELSQPVMVRVTPSVDNGRLQFTDERSVQVMAPPAGRASGVLHFRPIANGRTLVTLSLTTPDGLPLGDPVSTPVTVQAGFDVIVASVLLTALALLLALGVYRNVTRRRRKALQR